ncbi:MAG: hypothetical protein GF320_19425, partial [Armatimonadia bacterium]|nr:hypothetical protein [Armatimonadia bacterium]
MVRSAQPVTLALVTLLLAVGARADTAQPPMYVYYIGGEGCHGCEVGDTTIETVVAPDPQVRLTMVDLNQDYALAHALLTAAGVDDLPSAPSLLVGSTYVDNTAFGREAVVRALDRYRETGAPDLLPRARRLEGRTEDALPGELRRWGVLTVIVAGLLDGLNPCAFATLVFFLSYLAVAGAKGHRLLLVGLLYAAGVFLMYFLFGLGILKAVVSLEAFPAVRGILYGLMALVCLVFAVLSVHDAWQLRRGRSSRVKLQLPAALKRGTHEAVRRGVRAAWVLPGAFAAGGVVSLLEVACTGQVYVPAITYMVAAHEDVGSAVGWLLLYDLMFVAPLLVLLALVVSGVGSKTVARWAEGQAPSTKIMMAGLFLTATVFFVLKLAG